MPLQRGRADGPLEREGVLMASRCQLPGEAHGLGAGLGSLRVETSWTTP